jgi:hypothetical protein
VGFYCQPCLKVMRLTKPAFAGPGLGLAAASDNAK